ncbi:MAG: hypothetical protein ABI165_18875, partial [Bryobacteraceae bacterium]
SVIDQDGSINAPAPAGSIVTLYGTGGGALDGAPAGASDGNLARGAARLAGTVHVSIGGRDAPVLYAGAAPGLVNGVFQINVQVPGDTTSGPAGIIVNIGGQDSPKGANLAIR